MTDKSIVIKMLIYEHLLKRSEEKLMVYRLIGTKGPVDRDNRKRLRLEAGHCTKKLAGIYLEVNRHETN